MQRIAVLRANALGDFVFCVPALLALRAAYPAAEIVLLACPWHAEFLHDRPGPVDRVVVVPPSRGVREPRDGQVEDAGELERFFAGMRHEGFDLALQMHGGGRWSNPFVQRLGARLTAGCRAEDAAPLDRWVPYVYFQPETTRYLEIAGLVGAPPVTLEARIEVTDDDVAEAAPLTSAGAFAVLHPGATAPRRRWSPERFAAVGDALGEAGVRVILTGTPAEQPLVDRVAGAMRAPAADACGRLSLGGLAALLSRAAVVVSNDTGPLHLAHAVGAPTVGIFWVGNLINGAPLTRARHRPIGTFRIDCPRCGAPNVDTTCAHQDVSFVDDVHPREVTRAALDLLHGTAARAPG